MHGCIHVSNQGAATTLLSASHLAILIVSLRAPPPHPSAFCRPISAILHHAMLSFATLCCKLSPCLSQQTQSKQRNATSTLADNVCICVYMYVFAYVLYAKCTHIVVVVFGSVLCCRAALWWIDEQRRRWPIRTYSGQNWHFYNPIMSVCHKSQKHFLYITRKYENIPCNQSQLTNSSRNPARI